MQALSDKQALRKLIRHEKQLLSTEELSCQSEIVNQRLLAHPRLTAASVVMMYWSLPDEVCTHAAVEAVAAAGKTVALPVVVGDGLMQLRRYTGSASLKAGAYGIMEPQSEPFTAIGSIDLVVVPGMAFDPQGHRLGRGKGYYDRFLAAIPSVYKIGVCFDFQKVSHVPTSSNDIPVDEVL